MGKPYGKPKARGTKSQSRQSSAAAKQARTASVSRGLMKDRISALEAEVRILRTLHEALILEIRDLFAGQGQTLI